MEVKYYPRTVKHTLHDGSIATYSYQMRYYVKGKDATLPIITDETKQKMKTLYTAGVAVAKIARMTGTSVYQARKALGIQYKRPAANRSNTCDNEGLSV